MWRLEKKATSGLAALLLIGMAGCVDLNVENPNAANAERALSSADDTEALIAGAFNSWHACLWYNSQVMLLSNVAFQHTAPWANAGMEFYGRIPRVPTVNQAGGQDIGQINYCWTRAYRAVSAVQVGLKALDDEKVTLPADRATRARAYGKFMQGLAHATLALLYDSAFVYDETMDPTEVTLSGYQDVMAAALGYFAEAATIAGGASFTIPSTWMSQAVSSTTLAELARSLSASFRAGVARTPAERAAVDWAAVVADVNAGISETWDFVGDWINWYDQGLWYSFRPGWGNMGNWIHGMADQSGAYQTYMATPTAQKREFIIVTPDTRFPQGTTEAEQLDNAGEYFHVTTANDRVIGSRPDRGTWRWSYYRFTGFDWWHAASRVGPIPLVHVTEMQLLRAEAAHRSGDYTTVADIVNETRTAHGLNAAAGTQAGNNTDCVPKLPNGTCGDLWEMLKWEKRMELQWQHILRIGWWVDSRGWGDLHEGSLLQFPVPYSDMELLGQKAYNFGGVDGVSAAPVGTYGY